jgi:hypothetical protein
MRNNPPLMIQLLLFFDTFKSYMRGMVGNLRLWWVRNGAFLNLQAFDKLPVVIDLNFNFAIVFFNVAIIFIKASIIFSKLL